MDSVQKKRLLKKGGLSNQRFSDSKIYFFLLQNIQILTGIDVLHHSQTA